MDEAGSRALRLLIGTVNLGWAAWALIGALYFLSTPKSFVTEPPLNVMGIEAQCFVVIGVSLLACGAISLVSIAFPKLGRLAAILCAMWCLVMAVCLQLSTPSDIRNDIYAWLLLICAFTCVMRWALLVLEPHLVH